MLARLIVIAASLVLAACGTVSSERGTNSAASAADAAGAAATPPLTAAAEATAPEAAIASAETAPSEAAIASAEKQARLKKLLEQRMGVSPQNPDAKRILRTKMAMMVEPTMPYRGILDDGAPKLGETGIAGPIEYAPLLVGPKQRFYCVRAKLWSPTWPILAYRTTTFRIQVLADGTELVQSASTHVNGPIPRECHGPFEPLPELEQLRDKRRQALGKSV
jgi:hypothetical protein